MLATIDLFIVNIAFPTLQRSFHGAHLSTLSWGAGVSTFDLSRYMGASLTMIDRH